jgi:CDGSH-type Zn-finger protein
VRPDGPLKLTGRIRVEDAEGEILEEGEDVALCRCGASRTKPFCDGSHCKTDFQDPARFSDAKPEPLGDDDVLIVTCRSNGMLLARGPMEILDADDQVVTTRNKAALCRCGQSEKKPFCDVSHKRCGFIAD